MKKLSLILFLFSVSAFAQKTDSTKKQLGLVVKGDILTPIIGLIVEQGYCSFTIEKLLKKRHSIQLTYFESWLHYPDNWKLNLLQLMPEYKFFVSKKKLCSGYYIGAFGQFIHYKEIFENNPGGNELNVENYKEVALGGGISNGVQFYVFKKITIDILLGVGLYKPIYFYDIQTYNSFNGVITRVNFPEQYYNAAQFNFRAAINIGYKF
jgi:uncharacterized protein DUF3575